MKITIEATPEETKELLQAVGSNLEQQLVKIIHDPSDILKKSDQPSITSKFPSQLSERLEELIKVNISFIGNKRPVNFKDAQALHELIRSYNAARN